MTTILRVNNNNYNMGHFVSLVPVVAATTKMCGSEWRIVCTGALSAASAEAGEPFL